MTHSIPTHEFEPLLRPILSQACAVPGCPHKRDAHPAPRVDLLAALALAVDRAREDRTA